MTKEIKEIKKTEEVKQEIKKPLTPTISPSTQNNLEYFKNKLHHRRSNTPTQSNRSSPLRITITMTDEDLELFDESDLEVYEILMNAQKNNNENDLHNYRERVY